MYTHTLPSLGADITDYFNYGFTEETWRLYCEKQRKTRGEVAHLNKIAVSNNPWDFSNGIPSWYSSTSYTHTYTDSVVCSRLRLGLNSCVDLAAVLGNLGVVLLHIICMMLMILIFMSEFLIKSVMITQTVQTQSYKHTILA